jgi:hypothetical protein
LLGALGCCHQEAGADCCGMAFGAPVLPLEGALLGTAEGTLVGWSKVYGA